MSGRCLLCGTANATCGQPTAHRIVAVDEPVSGVKVAGNTIVPDLSAVRSMDMTDEEREEFKVMSASMARRNLRQRVRYASMADGKAPHTSLSYVLCSDGITRKMAPDVARQYVEMNDGSSKIVKEGALPVAREGEVIGATKATVGEMFDENGRQKEGVQPLTTRTFHATDRINNEAIQPAVGTTGAASSEVNTGTGDQTSSAHTPRARKPAD